MGRPKLPARLYLARSKDHAPNWVIRDGTLTVRTGAKEHETDKARDALHVHAIQTGQLGGIISEIDYRRPQTAATNLVYFISCDQPDFPIKIGAASDLGRRVRNLQNALPFDIVVLGTTSGSMLYERMLHTRFKHLRMRGEWFRRAPDLLHFIETETTR